MGRSAAGPLTTSMMPPNARPPETTNPPRTARAGAAAAARAEGSPRARGACTGPPALAAFSVAGAQGRYCLAHDEYASIEIVSKPGKRMFGAQAA